MFYCDCGTHENYENFSYSDWKTFCTECHAQLKVKCSICWKMFKSSKVRGREQYHLTHEYKCKECILKTRKVEFLLGKICYNINNYTLQVYSNCFDEKWLCKYRGNLIYVTSSICNMRCDICGDSFEDGFYFDIRNKISFFDNYCQVCYKCAIDRIIEELTKFLDLWEFESIECIGNNIPKYDNYYQWLPREVSEDIIELTIWRE